VIGAIHVLGIAWFGGTVLVTDRELRSTRRMGLAVMLLSGALLFWLEPLKCYNSAAFCMKMSFFALVLALPIRTRRGAWLLLTLWIAIVLAARGIAFF
jgi:hypothetical protein